MAFRKFHVRGGRYLHDDYDSGLYFDMYVVARPAGNEQVFNDAIDSANMELDAKEKELGEVGRDWLCTVVFDKQRFADFPASWKNTIAPKSYLLLKAPGFTATSAFPTNDWTSLDPKIGGNMIGVLDTTGTDPKKWVGYTQWDANYMGHVFRRATKDEVDAWLKLHPDVPPVVTPPDGGGTTNPPATTTLKHIHLKGSAGTFGAIDLTIDLE